MNVDDSVSLTRDVEAAMIPVATRVTLQKGEPAHTTKSVGGSYKVVDNGNIFRVEGKDDDAENVPIDDDRVTPTEGLGDVGLLPFLQGDPGPDGDHGRFHVAG